MLKVKPDMRDWSDADAMDGIPDEFMIEITEKGGKDIGKSEIMLEYGHKISRDELVDIVAYIRSLLP